MSAPPQLKALRPCAVSSVTLLGPESSSLPGSVVLESGPVGSGLAVSGVLKSGSGLVESRGGV